MEMLDVAKLIINSCIDKNIELNITKLHKLSYCVYGTYLRVLDEVLSYEDPLCYPTGVIFRGLQIEYKKGRLSFNTKYKIPAYVKKNKNVIAVIEATIRNFGKYHGGQLSDWNKRKGGAWYKMNKYSTMWGIGLNIDDVKKEFEKVLIIKKA